MHPQSPALTIGGTVLRESDDLVILWATFDSKMTFEKHLRSVSRAASQLLGILRKSWQRFHDRLLLGRCLWGFVLLVLEYCSVVWCSAADTHLKPLDCVVTGASFLTGGVFECDLAHRRSVAVLCMLYKIRCKSMHLLYGALPMPYVTRGAVIDIGTPMRLVAAEPRSIPGFLLPCQYLCGTILVAPYSMVSDFRVSRAGQCLFIGLAARSLFVSACFLFLFCYFMGWYCGAGVFGLIGC